MNLKFKANQIGQQILNDLLNNNGVKYKDLNDFIIEKFKIERDEYEGWLEDNDLRVYEGISYDAVIDSWFEVQHLYSTVNINKDTFEIIPPESCKDSYKDINTIYPNTKEGLEKAFFDTIMDEYVGKVVLNDKEYFICKDEI